MKPLRYFVTLALLALLQACASLTPVTKPESHAIAASPISGLSRIAEQSVPKDWSAGLRPLLQSDSAMDALLTMTAHAESSLDLQYYLLQNDGMGKLLLRGLRDAALRGVRVRLLVDDLYTSSTDHLLLALASYPNVEVRLFNPFPAGRGYLATRLAWSLFDFARINHRMHNKMFIVDGAFAIAGGRNIADEYFFRNVDGNFIDFDVLVAGRPVPQMAAIFDSYWNSKHVFPIHALAVGARDPVQLRERFERETTVPIDETALAAGSEHDVLGYGLLSADIKDKQIDMLGGDVQVFADRPEKVEGVSEVGVDPSTVTAHFLEALGQANSEVVLISPYFVPSDIGMQAIRDRTSRGQHIVMITNALAANDEPFAGAAYARFRLELLKMGVELHEIDSGNLKKDAWLAKALGSSAGKVHTKLTILDGRRIFVGSMNLDLRSSRKNTELGLLIDSPVLAAKMMARVNWIRETGSFSLRLNAAKDGIEWTHMENGKLVVHDSDPDLGWWPRLKVLLFSPFIPDSLCEAKYESDATRSAATLVPL